MDPKTRKLVANALAWKIEGTYWRDKDIEDCVESTHIEPKTSREAVTRAEKIVDAYVSQGSNPIPRTKRFLRDNERIWERRFDETIDDAISQAISDIQKFGLNDMITYLESPS